MITTLYKRPILATRAQIQEIRRRVKAITLDKFDQSVVYFTCHRDTATEMLAAIDNFAKHREKFLSKV